MVRMSLRGVVAFVIETSSFLFEMDGKSSKVTSVSLLVPTGTMSEANFTSDDHIQRAVLSPSQPATDPTGLFIGLFLLLLLFLLMAYLFYSFVSTKRGAAQNGSSRPADVDDSLHEKIIFNDHDDLINNDGEIVLGHQISFSDCGTSLGSSSMRSHVRRSSSYRLCSHTSNYLLTPRLSSQQTPNGDEYFTPTIIVEPNDIQLANALSRSISRYCERQRKPIARRRTFSYDDSIGRERPIANGLLKGAKSLPLRRRVLSTNPSRRPSRRQVSFRTKPTTIYELFKSDRMRISNLLVSDP